MGVYLSDFQGLIPMNGEIRKPKFCAIIHVKNVIPGNPRLTF